MEGSAEPQQSQGEAADDDGKGSAAAIGEPESGEGVVQESPVKRADSKGGLACDVNEVYSSVDVFRRRESSGFAAPKYRPLHTKLELLLDLIFRRLFWDPDQPEIAFSLEGVLRLLKKIDKDMGP